MVIDEIPYLFVLFCLGLCFYLGWDRLVGWHISSFVFYFIFRHWFLILQLSCSVRGLCLYLVSFFSLFFDLVTLFWSRIWTLYLSIYHLLYLPHWVVGFLFLVFFFFISLVCPAWVLGSW